MPHAIAVPGGVALAEPTLLAAHAAGAIAHLLRSVRSMLRMDVAFVAEFIGDRRVFRHVDATPSNRFVTVGDSHPLDEEYCGAIVAGRLPRLIPDTARVPAAMAIPATREMPIGAHVGVPIRRRDGEIYGSFCCFSAAPDHSLTERDLRMMEAFGDLLAFEIEADVGQLERRAEKLARIRDILASESPRIIYQPIFRLSDMTLSGAEALARFDTTPVRSPDAWFTEASDVGLGNELEMTAIRNALSGFRSIWRQHDLALELNCSPQTIIEGGLLDLMDDVPPHRVVLEITEHAYVSDYETLLQALAPLRSRRVKIAIDDAGSGYASMRHIINLAPDIIKLDMSLTAGIDGDLMKRALAGALVDFSRKSRCTIVAEGVETEEEMITLRDLGAHAAQGYHLGRPAPIEDLHRRLR